MNIGPNTFENAISASCIQLAQAYSVTEKISINDAKIKVKEYLDSLQEYKSEDNKTDILAILKEHIEQAIRNSSNKHEKAYYELLKILELFN